MQPTPFPEANTSFGPPSDLEESQCMTIAAFVHKVRGGMIDGALQTVVAWKPTPEEIELLKQGAPIYLSVLGGLPPHYLSMSFHDATHPA